MGFLKRWFHRRVAAAVNYLQGVECFAKCEQFRENGTLVVGRHTYGQPRIWEYCGSRCKVVIGSFCSISPEVEIITGGIHPTDWVSTFPFRIAWRMAGAYADGMPSSRGDTTIGSDVWIGTGAMILSGVMVGHGSVVAARSLVARDVPPYSIVAGRRPESSARASLPTSSPSFWRSLGGNGTTRRFESSCRCCRAPTWTGSRRQPCAAFLRSAPPTDAIEQIAFPSCQTPWN